MKIKKDLLWGYLVWALMLVVTFGAILFGRSEIILTNLNHLFSSLNISLQILVTNTVLVFLLPLYSLSRLFISTFYYYFPSLFKFPIFLGGRGDKRELAIKQVKNVIIYTMVAGACIDLLLVILFSTYNFSHVGQNALITLLVLVFGPIIIIDVYYEYKAFWLQSRALKK